MVNVRGVKNGVRSVVNKAGLKVKQTIAGLSALAADKNMKKAAAFERASNKMKRKQSEYGERASNEKLSSSQRIMYRDKEQEARLGARTYSETAKDLKKKANKQYSRADRLMGY